MAGRSKISGRIEFGKNREKQPIVVIASPFNNQAGRREAFSQILAAHRFAAIVETGTYHGRTTRFMAEASGLPVYSIEANEEHYRAAQRFLAGCANVSLFLGDSDDVLPRLLESGKVADNNVFYYLDAHWEEELPLGDEIETIISTMTDFVIMIDDFQVPDDPGYGFDKYGPGRNLDLGYLRRFAGKGLFAFLPSCPSAKETGARRGCIVLTATADIASAFRSVPALREAGTLDRLLSQYEGR